MSPSAITEPYSNGHTNGYNTTTTPSADTLKAALKHSNGHATSSPWPTYPKSLLRSFLDGWHDLERFRTGKAVSIDGETLSIAGVVAVARYGAAAGLSADASVRAQVDASRRVIASKVDERQSVYGVSTGFGGSADTRTDQPLLLGHALLQHQHAGVLPLPTPTAKGAPLPLLDPYASSAMPEAWVRAALLVRLNSLVRGHSGVRWELLQRMHALLEHEITPLVPLRGSISASGDLSPLSYIAGTITGEPAIRAWHSPSPGAQRELAKSGDALAAHGLRPLPLQSKEHLGILNGTAFSAGAAALVLHDAAHLALLGTVCTALGVEALLGTRASFDPFIHAVARPHPGQVQAARAVYELLEGSKLAEKEEHEVGLAEDKGTLRQDRYPLRTAPQFIGPQIEDILAALETVTQECNSTTDNPLIDGTTGHVHHGGNFQAMAVTSAVEKARLALHHVGKLLFAQCTELLNPAMNRGLPPSVAATDPALDYHAKGVDIACAAYVSELGFLANPVSTHVQSAEMHNQAVNSLALISARQTIDAVQVLSMLTASYLYVLCQALDLRALQADFATELAGIVDAQLSVAFVPSLDTSALAALRAPVARAVLESLEHTGTMDALPRCDEAAAQGVRAAVDTLSSLPAFTGPAASGAGVPFGALQTFRRNVGRQGAAALRRLRFEYLDGARGPAPGAAMLGKTRPVYEFVRRGLGVRMHGAENLHEFGRGLGVEDVSVGEKISVIYEAIRDGQMHGVVAGLFE